MIASLNVHLLFSFNQWNFLPLMSILLTKIHPRDIAVPSTIRHEIFSTDMFTASLSKKETYQPIPRHTVTSEEKEFPYLFRYLQGVFLLHPLFASFSLSLRAPGIIIMAIFTWLSGHVVFGFSGFLSWMSLPFFLSFLRL